MTQDVVKLSQDQLDVTIPAISNIKQKQNEINEIITTLQPVVRLLCKLNNLNPDEYVLSEDGRSLINRSTFNASVHKP